MSREWIGGQKYVRCQQQFQILFQRYGFKQAVALAEEAILWPDDRRPPKDIYKRWAIESDEDKADIPEAFEKAFQKRLDNMIRSHAEAAVIENARTARELAIQAREGKLDGSKAALYMHANNGTGFIYREIIGGSKFAKQEPQQTNFFINAGPAPKKLKPGKPALIEAQFKDVTAERNA